MQVFLMGFCLLSTLFAAGAGAENAEPSQSVRFMPLEVYIDSGEHALAAYQFELNVTAGDVKIVGIEGGEHPAFANPPYYDPKAMARGHIIIAAFSTDTILPSGRTRIATLHVQITGDIEPDYNLELSVSADTEGKTIPAAITLEQGETQ